MSTSILKKITIEHLRGSVRPFVLPFEKWKKLTVIYGENGAGKTTICDAFEFLGKGELGSLDKRGLGKTGKYWCSVGKKTADVTVSLETDDATCTAKITKSGVTALPADARPKVEVLRRSQILSIVEATPGERYAAISRFVDVTGVEASEAALQELIKSLNRSRETAVARVQENQDSINQFWESAGKPGSDPFIWASKELSADITALSAELQALGTLRIAHGKLLDYPAKYNEAREKLKTSQEEAKASAEKLEEQLKIVSEGAGEMVAILEAAKPFLVKHPQPAVCPL